MKTKLTLVFLLIAATALAQTFDVGSSAEEVPWWKQVDENLGLILKWIAALSVVFTAFVTAVFGAWKFIQAQLSEIRKHSEERDAELNKRQDRLVDEKRSLQTQINAVAIATDPAKSGTSNPRPIQAEVVNTSANPIPTVEKKP